MSVTAGQLSWDSNACAITADLFTGFTLLETEHLWRKEQNQKQLKTETLHTSVSWPTVVANVLPWVIFSAGLSKFQEKIALLSSIFPRVTFPFLCTSSTFLAERRCKTEIIRGEIGTSPGKFHAFQRKDSRDRDSIRDQVLWSKYWRGEFCLERSEQSILWNLALRIQLLWAIRKKRLLVVWRRHNTFGTFWKLDHVCMSFNQQKGGLDLTQFVDCIGSEAVSSVDRVDRLQCPRGHRPSLTFGSLLQIFCRQKHLSKSIMCGHRRGAIYWTLSRKWKFFEGEAGHHTSTQSENTVVGTWPLATEHLILGSQVQWWLRCLCLWDKPCSSGSRTLYTQPSSTTAPSDCCRQEEDCEGITRSMSHQHGLSAHHLQVWFEVAEAQKKPAFESDTTAL